MSPVPSKALILDSWTNGSNLLELRPMKVSQPTGSLCFPFVSIEYLHGPTGKKSKQTGVKKLFPPDLAIFNFIILKLLTLNILISIQQKTSEFVSA